MDAPTATLIIGILTFLGGLTSAWIAYRRLKREAPSMDADAIAKFQETLTRLQERNDTLYQENVQLQIKVTETSRTNEQIRIRLEERDAQLSAATRQLDLLRDMAKTANINEPLKEQLGAMNQVVVNLQRAQAELQQLLIDREKAFKELFDSTRGLIKVK